MQVGAWGWPEGEISEMLPAGLCRDATAVAEQFRAEHAVCWTPCIILDTHFSVLDTHFNVLGTHCSVVDTPGRVLDTTCSVLGTHC